MRKEAMKLALEALEYTPTLSPAVEELCDAAITALREALAEQPAPSQYGSPELQDMVLARAVKKINANSQPAQQQEPVVCTKCGASLGTLHLATGDKNCPFGQRVRHSDCTPQPAQQEPEIVQRVKRYAGQTPRTARNPNITARECIELANWIAATPHPAKQEPAAWMHEWEDGEKIPMLKGRDDRNQDKPKTVRPLVYGDTSPQPAQRTWVGLTDSEIEDCYQQGGIGRAAQILKEKNT